jgi:hypothetical protein
MIKNIRKSIMGTIRFDLKAKGHRGFQNFITYPMSEGSATDKVKVQSDKRIGWYVPDKGMFVLSKSRSSGSYNPHLYTDELIPTLIDETSNDLLKQAIALSFDKDAGNNGVVFTDNSNAINIL